MFNFYDFTILQFSRRIGINAGNKDRSGCLNVKRRLEKPFGQLLLLRTYMSERNCYVKEFVQSNNAA